MSNIQLIFTSRVNDTLAFVSERQSEEYSMAFHPNDGILHTLLFIGMGVCLVVILCYSYINSAE